VENALFATLDPTVRKAQTEDGREYTIADTVGFVRSLPHQLVEAFRSTFEEISHADLIIHVVDASHPDPSGQISTVRAVISDVDASEIDELIVFNKVDLIDDTTRMALRGMEPGALFVSARTGEGVDQLLETIAKRIPSPDVRVQVLIPYDKGALVSKIHQNGKLIFSEHGEVGTVIEALVKPELAAELKPYLQGA
ncbi:MAG: HflX GTPase family protein, partial [Micrococcales bacterium]